VNAPEDPFDRSRACFAELVGWLEGTEAAALSHADLEDQLDRRGRELLRQMFQGQLDLRALGEQRAAEVTDHKGPSCASSPQRANSRRIGPLPLLQADPSLRHACCRTRWLPQLAA
jgi:hypothetical protein